MFIIWMGLAAYLGHYLKQTTFTYGNRVFCFFASLLAFSLVEILWKTRRLLDPAVYNNIGPSGLGQEIFELCAQVTALTLALNYCVGIFSYSVAYNITKAPPKETNDELE